MWSTEFWNQGKEVQSVLEPLVIVLRLVDGDDSTAGYLYEAMEKARAALKLCANNDPAKYMKLWELFD